MKVFEYPLEVTETQIIKMPDGAKILCVQEHYGKPKIWALVDETKEEVDRFFATYETGHLILQNPGTYVGTYQLWGGTFLGHLFEVQS